MPYYTHNRATTDAGEVVRTGTAHDSKLAAVAARRDNDVITFVPTWIESDAWQQREQDRFGSGAYKLPTWHHSLGVGDHYTHYAHIATDGEKIAYTPDETYGHEDRQLTITAARYLQRFFPTLRADEVAFYVGGTRSSELKWARTADEIAAVYVTRHAFESCMGAHNFADAATHPTRVYAAGDLSIAYIGEVGTRILARGLCWEDRKVYTRLFGDSGALDAALRGLGFAQGNVYGARLNVERPYPGASEYRMPYVDWHDGASLQTINGTQYFVITDRDPEYGICQTGGTAYANRRVRTHDCHHCGAEGVSMDDSYCEDCNDDAYSCDGCGSTYFESDGSSQQYCHGTLCPDCDSENTRTCAHCDECFNGYDYQRRTRLPAGTTHTRQSVLAREICPTCFDDGIAQCPDCDTWAHLTDTFGHDNCAECRDAALRRSYAQARPRGVILRVWRVGTSDWDVVYVANAVALAGAETAAADVA